MINLEKDKKLLLFDGVCNLCNSSVQYIIKHDKKNIFMFSTLQSDTSQKIIKEYKIDVNKTDSIILYSPKKRIDYKSTAALKIASFLGFPNNLMSVFLIIPSVVRNWIYDYIAKNRYKWYGKRETCMVPTPEIKSKFID